MPTRKLPDGSDERVPLADDRAGYSATDADVKAIRDYYEGWEYSERRGQLVPDGWQSVRSGDKNQGGRHIFVMVPYDTDRVVEVSYRYDAEALPTDHQVRALPPEEAYKLLLDEDEAVRQRGFVIYDERHPRPA